MLKNTILRPDYRKDTEGIAWNRYQIKFIMQLFNAIDTIRHFASRWKMAQMVSETS